MKYAIVVLITLLMLNNVLAIELIIEDDLPDNKKVNSIFKTIMGMIGGYDKSVAITGVFDVDKAARDAGINRMYNGKYPIKKAWIEFSIKDDDDLNFVGSYFTEYKAKWTPGLWWERQMHAFYYDHLDVLGIDVAGDESFEEDIMPYVEYKTDDYRKHYKTRNNKPDGGSFYTDEYRENFGCYGNIVKQLIFTEDMINYIQLTGYSNFNIYGLIEKTQKKSNLTSAPGWLKATWEDKYKGCDGILVYAKLHIEFDEEELMNERNKAVVNIINSFLLDD